MPKMKAYVSFAEWKKDQSMKNQRLITALARVIEGSLPQLARTVKWGQGCWAEQGVPRVYLHAEPDHVQLGFYRGSTMQDPRRLLAGSGKYVRHVKVYSARDIDREAFSELIRQASTGPGRAD
jgi:hypothetical protein